MVLIKKLIYHAGGTVGNSHERVREDPSTAIGGGDDVEGRPVHGAVDDGVGVAGTFEESIESPQYEGAAGFHCQVGAGQALVDGKDIVGSGGKIVDLKGATRL